MKWFAGKIRVAPALAAVALLCLSVHLGAVIKDFSGSARAEDTAPAEAAKEPVAADDAVPPPLDPASAKQDDKPDDKGADASGVSTEEEDPAAKDDEKGERIASPSAMPPPLMKNGEKVEWKDPSDFDFQYSKVEENLYKDLTARREALDKREKELAVRQALLEAAERELDQKINEMNSLKGQIEGLLQQQSDEEKARTASLVKIYEGMKAKDAAAIFNDMEDGVLLEILSHMSERKSAPVIAAMNPDRARAITLMLAEQKKMPEGVSELMNTQ